MELIEITIHIQTEDGSSPLRDGCGNQNTLTETNAITMADGFTQVIMAGYGCRADAGRQTGFHGGIAATITDGILPRPEFTGEHITIRIL